MKITAAFVTSVLAFVTASSATAISARVSQAEWSLESVTAKSANALCKTQSHANLGDISENVDMIIASSPGRMYGQDEQIAGKRDAGGSSPGIMIKIQGTTTEYPIEHIKYLLNGFHLNGINRCGAISMEYNTSLPADQNDAMVKHGWLKMDYTGDVEVANA
ncbi:Uu.00g145170.m01.CDS01 [Anthostomella pinea]|uniref:Uu.00g145170.m01.CDS01 n=1 Tax=Anthostomella pinea TaxID=933095 RepID=A0AAI8VQZ0_9PEZI|nr:Uu.00g145170.m01.CDS01 [Anthostomella pinea]